MTEMHLNKGDFGTEEGLQTSLSGRLFNYKGTNEDVWVAVAKNAAIIVKGD